MGQQKTRKQSIYRLAKSRERKTRFKQVRCIKGDDGKILFIQQDIKDRWKSCSYKFSNEGHWVYQL